MSPEDAELLARLAAMPFLDRLELAALAGRSRSAVFRRVAALERVGLLESFVHSTELIPATRRYGLTAEGVRQLARSEGLSAAELLRRDPLSQQERRLVLERLDGASAIYRLAAALAEAVYPLEFRWQRARPLDAVMRPPDGRRIAVVRLGRTAERTAVAKRLRRLRRTQGLGAVLLLAPDEVRLRQVRRLVAGAPAITFLALETEAVRSGADARIWRAPSGAARLSLRETAGYVVAHRGWTAERPLSRLSPPRPLDQQGKHRATASEAPAARDATAAPPAWLLPARLTASEKRALDAVGDWPWIRPAHLHPLVGVGARRLAQLLERPTELELVRAVMIAGRRRLVLTEAGIGLLARRDRTSVGAARKRWSPRPRPPAEPGAAFDWRDVVGRRARQLVRNLDHTESVHWWSAVLSEQARRESRTLAQLDPPHRASRYFRHQGRMRSIHPDAFGVLRSEGEDWPFFLEWERRAVRPATMRARLAPYLRYYDTDRPLEDHGVRPALLVVFEDGLAADHFRRLAAEEMERAEVEVPLLVSDRGALERSGALGSGWRAVRGPASER